MASSSSKTQLTVTASSDNGQVGRARQLLQPSTMRGTLFSMRFAIVPIAIAIGVAVFLAFALNNIPPLPASVARAASLDNDMAMSNLWHARQLADNSSLVYRDKYTLALDDILASDHDNKDKVGGCASLGISRLAFLWSSKAIFNTETKMTRAVVSARNDAKGCEARARDLTRRLDDLKNGLSVEMNDVRQIKEHCHEAAMGLHFSVDADKEKLWFDTRRREIVIRHVLAALDLAKGRKAWEAARHSKMVEDLDSISLHTTLASRKMELWPLVAHWLGGDWEAVADFETWCAENPLRHWFPMRSQPS